ncbi:hypothetical protein FB451DRAFT_1439256 [Mycena latifolia]|nr:hypothetical protein FB451DRAFT_1439256 [Mycena latifolia]
MANGMWVSPNMSPLKWWTEISRKMVYEAKSGKVRKVGMKGLKIQFHDGIKSQRLIASNPSFPFSSERSNPSSRSEWSPSSVKEFGHEPASVNKAADFSAQFSVLHRDSSIFRNRVQDGQLGNESVSRFAQGVEISAILVGYNRELGDGSVSSQDLTNCVSVRGSSEANPAKIAGRTGNERLEIRKEKTWIFENAPSYFLQGRRPEVFHDAPIRSIETPETRQVNDVTMLRPGFVEGDAETRFDEV